MEANRKYGHRRDMEPDKRLTGVMVAWGGKCLGRTHRQWSSLKERLW